MQHPEPEDLALAALGEQLDETTRSHVDACDECAAEIAALADAVSVGRAVAPDGSDLLVAPPADLWGRIRAELDLPADLEPGEPLTSMADAATAPLEPAAPLAPTALPAPTAPPAPTAETPTESATVVPVAVVRRLRDRSARPSSGERRPPTGRWLAVAATAGIVVGGGGMKVWSDRSDPAPAVVEAAALDALPGWDGATGAATVEVAADGTRELVITLAATTPGDGYREVWVIDTEVTKLVSLGVLDGSTGTFTLPPGLDLGEFPVVDISEEHFDGDPAHSGDSIVRGILET